MTGLELLKSVRFVVDQEGQPSAVQIDMATWQSLIDWLEEVEDTAAVKAALPRLLAGPERSGALRWNDVREEWDEESA